MAKRPKSSPSIDSTSFPSSPVITTSSSSRMRTRPTSAGSDKLKTTMTTTESKSHTMLPAFLSKTFEIFSMPEFSSICGWNTSGDTIIVSQLESFVALVLPRFFKHRNFPSFVRQLNLYGFHKTVLDSKRLEFQHAYFKRDRPDLLPLIKRKVSTPSSSTAMTTSNSSSATNSRLELHRELSDQLLKEIKELRQKSDAMEKRLREVEVDNAIVRSDNIKLWKHLESAKDKQLMMQEKMKKIMWILYQIYRGKQVIPKLGQEEDESRLAPNEFRDVLRFLAMDEPPMLAQSSTADKSNARKRKFVEVASLDEGGYNSIGPSVVEVTNPLLCQKTSPELPPIGTESNVLSIFNPMSIPRSMDTISLPPTTSEPNDPISVPPATPDLYLNPTSPITSVTTFGASGGSEVGGVEEDVSSAEGTLDFIDDALPLLNDTDQYPFTAQQEHHVMQKLEDFESSLLDEYDVGCLDTLMQQLRNTNTDKTSLERSSFDREELVPNGLDDVLQGSL